MASAKQFFLVTALLIVGGVTALSGCTADVALVDSESVDAEQLPVLDGDDEAALIEIESADYGNRANHVVCELRASQLAGHLYKCRAERWRYDIWLLKYQTRVPSCAKLHQKYCTLISEQHMSKVGSGCL